MKNKFKSKFTDDEIETSINKIVYEAIQLETIKPNKLKKVIKKKVLPATQEENGAAVVFSHEETVSVNEKTDDNASTTSTN